MRILILGGYGVFGGRLAQLISDLPVEVLVAGRSASKAGAFCAAAEGTASFTPLVVDRDQIADTLRSQKPDMLVDASGPFQAYGADPYNVIRACIDTGTHYLDFADGADFVFGVDQFDTAARDAGVFILSGVSSFPVLTAAVLRHLGHDMQITHVTGGIAPSPHAGIGLNVMRAVLSYAGAPVQMIRGGRPITAMGLTENRFATIAPPGKLPLKRLRFSLVDVPDLRVIPPEHPAIQEVWMGAGPVPDILHRMLNLCAKARAKGWLPPLAPFASLFYRALNLMKFGPHRGGMFIDARGHDKDGPRAKSWHLLAEGDDGPLIPSMAIEAIIRKTIAGNAPAPGARAATHVLELSDYDTLFVARQITTGHYDSRDQNKPIYPRILGSAFDTLPDQVKRLRDSDQSREWHGEAEITPSGHALGRLIARAFSFPTKARTCPVSVRFDPDETGELWTRDFGGQIMVSHQSFGKTRDQHHMVERFGPVAVALALVVKEGKLHFIPRHIRLFGLNLPGWMLPKGDSYETEIDGRFRFHVEIRVPVLGRLVRYQGWLTPELPSAAGATLIG